jgi:hypothetical protein
VTQHGESALFFVLLTSAAAAAGCRSEPSLSLAFEYAEHDMYEIIWHHRDRLAGAAAALTLSNTQTYLSAYTLYAPLTFQGDAADYLTR